ncbi:MAG: amidohydrolase [Bacteroidia bacterium]|nr:amidohydrolase [Bacteroidia bacterium]
MNQLFLDKTTAIEAELISIRRHLHQFPELSFVEYKTSEFIQAKLTEWNIPFTTGWAKTGIVGVLHGKNPESKCIALRADIDALPIQELNQVDYKSCNNGVMHACGHDVHSTCLLGAIQVLYQTRNEWEGTVKFIFQPGEEKLPGGASILIQEGVLQNPKPDAIIGLHVLPQMETGFLGLKPGMFMASSDEIYLTIKGKGGHGALPQTLIDPVLISAHVLIALQQIVSRNASPIVPSVLSFGKIIGNGATNVIPDEVTIEGTFRTFDETWRERAHQKIHEICSGICTSFGASCDVNIVKGYPFLVNDEKISQQVEKSLKSTFGEDQILSLETRMTAEDFAYYSQEIPACFFRLGTGNYSKGITAGIHTATFDVDERCLLIGTRALLASVLGIHTA